MTSKSTFSPEESKSRILRSYCGDRSINRPIGFRIDSRLLGRGPSKDVYLSEDTKLLGSMRPRTIASEDDRDVVLLRSDLRIRSP